ncbi:MAG TPA: hypothetical protein VMV83_16550 [Rectinemataceae bacterium]|nr:hypothetical protein [Rectinemataceae bacterium]
MPLLKRKSLEDLVPDRDFLYSPAGNIASPGTPITDALIQRLAAHHVPVVTVLFPSREEIAQGLGLAPIEKTIKEKEEGEFAILRNRLFESAKKIYKPYSEKTNRAFWGKLGEKVIKPDFLLDRKCEALYRNGAYMGSLSLFSTSGANNQYDDRKAIHDALDGIYSHLEAFEYRSPETARGAKTMPRLFLDSIRLGTIYDPAVKDRVRILDPGNALAWHATDTAILTLASLLNMSKKRRTLGFPESIDEFEKAKKSVTSHATIREKVERFHYPKETVLAAALGCVLHSLGYAHLSVNRVVSRRPLLDGSPRSQDDLKTLRKGQFAVRNLFESRDDVSAVSKKIIYQMKQYPDGSGYPLVDPAELRFVPEYARMAVIADDYDELVNPVLNPHPMGRSEAVRLLYSRSGDYKAGEISARYDKTLLDEFTQLLKPYEVNERVDLCLAGQPTQRYYCGVSRSYGLTRGHLPQVSILKSVATGETFAFGKLLFDLEGGRILLLDDKGKVGAVYERSRLDEKDETGAFKLKNPKLREMLEHLPDLAVLEDIKGAWTAAEYVDPVYGASKPTK